MAENPSGPGPDDDDPQDPFSRMFGNLFGQAGGSGAPSQGDLQAMFGQMQQFFGAMAAGGDSPVNWTLAKDAARRGVEQESRVDSTQLRDVAEAARLADLWLDAATDFTSASTQARALSRSEWIDATLPQWQQLAEPVAQSAADAVSGSLAGQLPPEAAAMLGQAGGMLKSLGGALFGAQLGQAVGTLAGEVLGGTDAGLPLAGRTFALVPQNIEAFGSGLELPHQEVLLYLALREAAHQRLFHSASWLEEHVLGLVRDFAAGLNIDTAGIQDRLQGIDPTNPAALQEIMSSGMLEPTVTPQQQAALTRLQTTLALIEGWVDAVVTGAADHLPSAPALRETLQRRRATGGPAEQTFAGLIGLQLRPRRAREAAALWEAIATQKGTTWRDDLWLDPALVPTEEDLEDPDGFFGRRALIGASDEDFDAAVSAWLGGPSESSQASDQDAAGDEAAEDEAEGKDAAENEATGDQAAGDDAGEPDDDRGRDQTDGEQGDGEQGDGPRS